MPVSDDFRLGPWLIQPSLNSVSRDGTSLRLEPKVVEVLVCLAGRAGQTVSKDDLLRTVWPDAFVSDDVLTRCISELRRVFEDDAKAPRFIQTIPRRGYRLVIAPVAVDADARDPSYAPESIPQQLPSWAKPSGWPRVFVGVAGLILLFLGLVAALNPGNVRARLWNTGSASEIHSLAVLPLKNLSGDPSQEYFADGMTDQLITSLSQNHDLRVISYTSVLGYKNTKKLAPEIARELGVDALVEGSVQRTGGRVRVNAQLIYAPQDAHLWAHSYASDLQDALTMQSELAGAIAGQVNARLTPAFQARLRVPHPVNLKALESYLQGNAYLAKVGKRSSVGDAQMAIEFFQNAIREDPTFAAAYLKICQVYEVQSVLFSKAERWPKEKAAAEKALALDPNLAGAHLELGLVKMSYDFDLAGAGAEFERAIELDPNSANAHESYGDYLESINRLDEGLREHQLAQSLDPGADHMSNSLYRHRQYDQAIELLKKRVETQLDDGAAHYGLSHNYAQKGMQKDFVYEFQKTAVWYGYDDVAKAVGRVYALHGYRAAQQEVARQLELYYARGELDRPVQIAIAYCRMGEKEQALRWMEQGFKDRDADLVMLYPEPEVDFLRSDPRFKDLMRRVGVSTQ